MKLFEEQKVQTEDRIQNGIEQFRKGYAHVEIKDKDGKSISGAKVRVNQKSHAFRFGANLFMLDEMETKEKNEAYKKHFADLFNMATLPFYWDATEPEKGKTRYAKDSEKLYRRPPIDLCIAFCEANGIEPREHALAYDRFFPKWLYDASVEEVKQALVNRYREISGRYADKIPTIEVTNEMEWPDCKTAFYNEPDFVEWCFKTAEIFFPANQLVVNEWMGLCWEDCCRFNDKYYSYIENTMLKDARIDAVGMQFHTFFRAEEEYEKTRPYYDSEAIKASQGNMTLGENYFYGGLMRFDLTPKPSYYALKKLIQEEWHTEEMLETNKEGKMAFKGFYGTYDLEIEVDGIKINRTIELKKNGINQFTIEV